MTRSRPTRRPPSRRRGWFIVLEGADGVGKSTQAKLLARRLQEAGIDVLLLREPGGTPLGEHVRRILLDPATGDIDPITELFLFMAARSHLTARTIEPALARGRTVICDRYLWSSVVYQGIVGAVGARQVLELGRLAGVPRPDRTFLVDVPAPAAAGRRSEAERSDRMERKGLRFQESVRRGFRSLARRWPAGVAVIDGTGAPEEVHRRIVEALPAGLRRGGSRR